MKFDTFPKREKWYKTEPLAKSTHKAKYKYKHQALTTLLSPSTHPPIHPIIHWPIDPPTHPPALYLPPFWTTPLISDVKIWWQRCRSEAPGQPLLQYNMNLVRPPLVFASLKGSGCNWMLTSRQVLEHPLEPAPTKTNWLVALTIIFCVCKRPVCTAPNSAPIKLIL